MSVPARPTPDGDGWLDANEDFRVPLLALVLMALLAGFADAVALLQWQVFVANQSGNVVRTGMGMAGADALTGTDWRVSLLSVVSFGLGGAVSYVVGRRPGRVAPPAVRLVVAALSLAAWLVLIVLAAPEATVREVGSVAALAFAMGVVATTFVRLGPVQVTTTYATGAVLRIGQGAVRATEGDAGQRVDARHAVAVTAVMIGSYAGGGAAGTLGVEHLDPLWRALVALALVAGVAALLRRVRL